MPIITGQGIYTTELCENSKKYLSRLLLGKAITHPNWLNWAIFTTKEFNIHPLAQTTSKQKVIDKLIEIEALHNKESLKPYHPEVKKQLAELRSKQLAWISLIIIVGVAAAFAVSLALGLLGSSALLMGVVGFALAACLTCCTIIPAFFGVTLIDPEWVKEFYIQQEKGEKKITAMKEAKTEIINKETAEQNSHTTLPTPQQTPLHQTQTTDAATSSNFPNITFFKDTQASDLIQLQVFNTFTNKSC